MNIENYLKTERLDVIFASHIFDRMKYFLIYFDEYLEKFQ